MTPEQLIIRADHANRILNDSLFQEAMQTLERDVFEAWARMPIRDKEGQHELLLMIQTTRKFKAIFEAVLYSGKLEKKELERPKLKQVLGRFGL